MYDEPEKGTISYHVFFPPSFLRSIFFLGKRDSCKKRDLFSVKQATDHEIEKGGRILPSILACSFFFFGRGDYARTERGADWVSEWMGVEVQVLFSKSCQAVCSRKGLLLAVLYFSLCTCTYGTVACTCMYYQYECATYRTVHNQSFLHQHN